MKTKLKYIIEYFRNSLDRVVVRTAPVFCVFLLLMLNSCDTCTGVSGTGINPENEVYYTAFPLNGVVPNIYRTDFEGSIIQDLVHDGITFSSPSQSGRIAYVRKNSTSGRNDLYTSSIDGSKVKLIGSENDIFSISVPILSPNGKYITFSAGNSRLFYFDNNASSSVFNQITGRLASRCQPSFSPDSRYLAYFEGDGLTLPYTLKVIEADSPDNIITVYSKELSNAIFPQSSEIAVTWSFNSESVLFTIQNGDSDDLHVINILTSSERILSIPNTKIGANQAVMNPTEDFVAVSGRDGNIWLIFIATNDLRFSKLTGSSDIETYRNPKWSPDGTKLLVNCFSSFDSDNYSTLMCMGLKFDVTLAHTDKIFILSANAYQGFWNYTAKVE
ncbi:MAG: hypothetical protein RBT61_03180 [Candidatus Kapabacteria bacterium]|jgi:Tol biopolymer transport system component|nr:hypothetical protein [Candidatus Kapabacteria bacterium]